MNSDASSRLIGDECESNVHVFFDHHFHTKRSLRCILNGKRDCSMAANIAAAFALPAGNPDRLTENSSVRQLRGIGRQMATQLGSNIHPVGAAPGYEPTLLDVVQYFNNQSRGWIYNHLTVLVQNPRAGRAVATSGARATAFAATAAGAHGAIPQIKHHVPDVNSWAFNTIVELLRYARNNPGDFTIPGGIHMISLPTYLTPLTIQESMCGGLRSQASCNKFNVCEWKEAEDHSCSACLPRHLPGTPELKGFAGVANFKGQKDQPGKTLRPGTQNVRGWRRSGAVARVTLPGMAPLPPLPPARARGRGRGRGRGGRGRGRGAGRGGAAFWVGYHIGLARGRGRGRGGGRGRGRGRGARGARGRGG